jgi:hypothetical protein
MREGGGLDTCNRVPKDGLDVLTKLKTWFTVYGPTALRDIYEDVLMGRIGSGLKSETWGTQAPREVCGSHPFDFVQYWSATINPVALGP